MYCCACCSRKKVEPLVDDTDEDSDDGISRAVASVARKAWDEVDDVADDFWAGVMRAVWTPSPLCELSVKITVAALLYAGMLSISIWLLYHAGYSSAAYEPVVELTLSDGLLRTLKIQMSACALEIKQVSGQGIRITDSTLQSGYEHSSAVELSDTGSCLVATCRGPSEQLGFITTARLEIGQDLSVNKTIVFMRTGGRSSLLLADAPYGSSLEVRGDAAVIQVDGVSVPTLQVVIRSGFLDVRNAPIPQAMLDIGAAVLSIQLVSAAQLDLNLSMDVLAADVSDSLCLSDVNGVPAIQAASNVSAYVLFSGGVAMSSAPASVISVIRGAGGTFGQLHASYGTALANRSVFNTYDTTKGRGFETESTFGAWALRMHNAGMQILRMRVLGPGADDDLGGLYARGEWVYSFYGDVYIWHPPALFWLSSFGLFWPPTARADVVLTSARCMPYVSIADEVCAGDADYGTDLLGGTHYALTAALPEVMSIANATKSELYHVVGPRSLWEFGPTMSIADGTVTAFTASATGSSMRFSVTNDARKFMDTRSMTFAIMGLCVAFLVPCVACWFLIKVYRQQRRIILASEGKRLWPLLWDVTLKREKNQAVIPNSTGTPKSEAGQTSWTTVDALDSRGKLASKRAHKLIARANLFLSVMECSILKRSKTIGWKVDGLPRALGLVLAQFTLVQSVLLPLYTYIALELNNVYDRQAGCATIDVIDGHCNRPAKLLLITFLAVLIVMQVFMLLYTVIEYLARQLDHIIFADGRPAGKRMSIHRKRLLHIRAHPVSQWCFSILFVFNMYHAMVIVVVFVLYITICACVAPTRIIPVLFAAAALLYVGNRSYHNLWKLEESLEGKFRQMKSEVAGEDETISDAVFSTLTDIGLNNLQIVLITGFTCIVFLVVLIFLLLGCSLFISTGSIVPTIVASGLSCSSAFAAVASGDVPDQSARMFQWSAKYHGHLQEISNLAADTTKLLKPPSDSEPA